MSRIVNQCQWYIRKLILASLLTLWGRAWYIYHFEYISKIRYRKAPRSARPVPSRPVPQEIMSRTAEDHFPSRKALRYPIFEIYSKWYIYHARPQSVKRIIQHMIPSVNLTH